MLFRRTSALTAWMLIALLLSVLLTPACRNRKQPGGESNAEPAGEPEQYSATVVRIIDDGKTLDTRITREARSGDQRREEWTEGGQNRALICRPELGKSFLLDLDRRIYVELDFDGVGDRPSRAGSNGSQYLSGAKSPSEPESGDRSAQTIDHYFGDTQPPARVETRDLPAAVIEGHTCAVYEQRSIYPDGHVETIRRFQARDLSGLLLRVESETNQANSRVITERRDIRTQVAPDTFVVPADFKKVERLPQ